MPWEAHIHRLEATKYPSLPQQPGTCSFQTLNLKFPMKDSSLIKHIRNKRCIALTNIGECSFRMTDLF